MTKKVKIVKYKHSDVLNWVFNNKSVEVTLISRWDRHPYQRTAWMVRSTSKEGNDFAVPEDELFPL